VVVKEIYTYIVSLQTIIFTSNIMIVNETECLFIQSESYAHSSFGTLQKQKDIFELLEHLKCMYI